jgi:hypothetical protein
MFEIFNKLQHPSYFLSCFGWMEADQENLLLVSDLIRSRRIIFSALRHYVNMHVNFVKVKSWIDFSSKQQNEKNLRLGS